MSKPTPFRGIPRALLDRADFQALSAEARHTLLVLKISMGPSGIEVDYPDALLARASAQSGLSLPDLSSSLSELKTASWIRRQQNVIWVVRQLAEEPLLVKANLNHRSSVESHVRSLPKLSVVGAFIEYYRDWFDDPIALRNEYPSEPYCDPISNASTTHPDHREPKPSTEDGVPKTEIAPAGGAESSLMECLAEAESESSPSLAHCLADESPTRKSVIDESRRDKGGWPAEFARDYEAIGLIPPARIGKACKLAVDKYTLPVVREMWAAYIRGRPHLRFGIFEPDYHDTTGMGPEDFAKNARLWWDRIQPIESMNGRDHDPA